MITDLILSKTSATATSTWTGRYIVGGGFEYTTPTWDYDSITITVPAALTGAVFNAATLTVNRNMVSGSAFIRFDDTREDVTNARLLARLQAGAKTIKLLFGFKASGGSGGSGEHSAVARWWGTAYEQPITLTVDYLPASAISGTVSAGASSVFYSVKQPSIQLSETGNIILSVTPSAALTAVSVDIRPHGQTGYKTLSYSVTAAAGTQTALDKAFTLDGLTLDSRVCSADLRFTLTTAAGVQASEWVTTPLKLVRERRAPIINTLWEDETNILTRFGYFVQGKSRPYLTLTVTLDTDADPDITTRARVLNIGGETYESGNNVFSIGEIGVYGTANYDITVTDSYGVTGSLSGALDILQYAAPTLSLLTIERYVTRQSEGGESYDELDDDGTHVWVTLKGDVSPLNGKNAWRVVLEYGGTESVILAGADGRTLDYTRDKSLITGAFSELTEHTLTIVIADEFEGERYSITLPKAGAIFSIEKGGVAVGKRCTAQANDPRFMCAYPAVFERGIFDADGNPIGGETYSEAPTPCGTWIDGRTVYRKVLTGVAGSGTYYINMGGIQIDALIRMYGAVHTTDGRWQAVNGYYNSSYRYSVQVYDDTRLICVTGAAVNKGAIILEYVTA